MVLLYIIQNIKGKGGLQHILFDKINSFALHDEIHVIHFGTDNDRPDYPIDGKVVFRPIDTDADNNKIKSLFKSIKVFYKTVEEIKPDIIVNANTKILSWFIPFFFRKIPKIAELHNSYDGVRIYNAVAYGKLKRKLHMMLRDIVYPLYDKIIVLTERDKTLWGYNNIDVIPNFTNLHRTALHTKKKKQMIWIGRLTHQKAPDLLLEIWDKFCNIDKTWELIIIGQGNGRYQKQLNDYLNESPNAERIRYIPKTDKVADYYQQASLFISTSRYEGLPLVMIEAVTMGLPLLGFDITGNTEVLKDGVNGVLVPPCGIDEYVHSLAHLCAEKAILDKMSDESRKIAENFLKETILKQWRRLFADVTNAI